MVMGSVGFMTEARWVGLGLKKWLMSNSGP